MRVQPKGFRLVQGELLSKRREDLQMPQSKVARRLGVHPQFVSNFERGISPVPVEKITKLAGILELKPDQIIDSMVSDYKNWILKEMK